MASRQEHTTPASALPAGPGTSARHFAAARAGVPRSAQLAGPDLEVVVACARADAQRHVAAWRTGYEGSLDVSLSWLISSRELSLGASLREPYTAALAAEARRLHAKLVVRAAATAVDWVHRPDGTPDSGSHVPDQTFLTSQWGIVAAEIGVQTDNELLRVAFEQLVRVAVARELAYVGIARRIAPGDLAKLDF